MHKFIFISNYVPDQFDSSNSYKVTHEFEAGELDTILAQFGDFLRGTGFSFEGQLEVVNDYPESKAMPEEPPLERVTSKKEMEDFVKNDKNSQQASDLKGPFYVDPPSGWSYGFPRIYDEHSDGSLVGFLKRHGYPEKDAEWAVKHCRFWPANWSEPTPRSLWGGITPLSGKL